MTKLCPNGHEVNDKLNFCPQCGAKFGESTAMFCIKCGNERKGTDKFCSQCGTPFGVSPMLGNNKTPKKSSKKGIVIAAVMCLLMLATGGAAWYFLQKDKYSLEGLALAAVNYDWIEDFCDGLAVAHKGDKHGYIDKMGNEVIPCIYEGEAWTATFYEGLALVKQGNRTFFIDKKGKEAFSFNYEGAEPFHEGLALAWKDGKYGYIDKKGNEVIPLTDRYQGEDFSEGLAAVCKDGKYGYIDTKGNIVIPIQYEDESIGFAKPRFNGGFATIKKNGKYGFIDTKGNEVASCKYDLVGGFYEGLAEIKKDGKWGFIDTKGNEVIPPIYYSSRHFSDGFAAVQKDGKWGYVDTKGKEAIPCSFDDAKFFDEGYALVSKDGNDFLIDKEGKEIVSFKIEEAHTISYFCEGIAVVKEYPDEGELYGFVDKDGKEIAPCIYDMCRDFSEGLAVVQKDGVYGFIDKKGNSTFDIQNEDVKRVVQAKIKQEEEERRRIKEEAHRKASMAAAQKIYSYANRTVWIFSKEYTPSSSRNRVEINEVLYFYPSSETSGMVSYVQYKTKFSYSGNMSWKSDFWARFETYFPNCSAKASYSVRDGVIHVNMITKNAYTEQLGLLDLEITDDGNLIRQSNGNKFFRHSSQGFKDPLR